MGDRFTIRSAVAGRQRLPSLRATGSGVAMTATIVGSCRRAVHEALHAALAHTSVCSCVFCPDPALDSCGLGRMPCPAPAS